MTGSRTTNVLLSICLVAVCSLARQAGSSDSLLVLVQTMREEMAASSAPGAVFAVVQNGKIVYQKALGIANLNTKTSLEPISTFSIGSVGKFFTSLALLTALEQHGIDVHASVGSIVPGLSPKLSPLAIASLLSNTSGMLDLWQNTNEHKDDLFELFQKTGDNALFEEQGRVFSYSNYGFTLAGLVLSRLTKISFTEAIDSLVIHPLKLGHTTFDVKQAMREPFAAAGHTRNPASGSVTNSPFTFVTDPVIQPAGGIFSNIEDLSRLAQCFFDDGMFEGKRIFSSKTIRAMSQGNKPINAQHEYLGYPGSSYGYGSIVFERNGIQFVGIAGESGNQNALFLLAPEFKTAFIALSNTGYHPFIRPIEKAIELFLPVKESKSSPWTAEQREEFLGKYYTPKLNKTRIDTIEIISRGSGLFIRMPNKQEFTLKRTGDRLYEFIDPEMTFPLAITFYPDATGKIKYLNYFWRTRIKVQ
jgi:CubicO group peptidase (beta-lactamase class C family)